MHSSVGAQISITQHINPLNTSLSRSLERQLTSKAASLPAEPPADDAEAVNLMVN